MPVALEKFVQQLVDSGILAGNTIQDFMPPKASPKNAEELARALVRKKKLTKFQAEEVSKGKGRSLVFGNYVLMEKIGAGGMGQVFKARHRVMERIVAVKMLPNAKTKDQAAIARFGREVEAAAKLRHPNIVAADDADCANGVHFLVMELVEGCDLSTLVKMNGPFSVEKAVNYVQQAAKGLEFAHKKGVVHRDIKPANLMLDSEGVIKILDMGLARLGADDDAPKADLTSTGAIMGTVDYMAPEQALDTKTADARADVYSLGCSLYYLLTGKATYEGNTVMKILMSHRDQPVPSLRAARPDVSEQLDIVFKKMVAKKLEDRYQTMSDVIETLEKVVAGQATADTNIESPSSIYDEFPTLISVAPAVANPALGKPAASWAKQTFITMGLAVLSMLILASIIVSLQTKDGNLIVEVNQKDALVQVLDEEGKVEVSQNGGGKITISVDPGKHRLKIVKDGFAVFAQEFEMEKGSRKEISARLEPTEIKPAKAATRNPPEPQGEIKSLFFQTPKFDGWIQQVTRLTADKQVQAVSRKLVELNPEFDGKCDSTPITEEGVVVEFSFLTNNVTDISPVRAFTGLRVLTCKGSNRSGKLFDLSPLHGMALNTLNCDGNQSLSDLTPLEGLPLNSLNCNSTRVSNLSPLQATRLTDLSVMDTPVSDLSPLKQLRLTGLQCSGTQVSDLSPLKDMKLIQLQCGYLPALLDLSPLRGMPLNELACGGTNVSDFTPLKGMPLTQLWCGGTRVADLTPLKGMKLLELRCDQTPVSDLSPLKGMPLIVLVCTETRVSDLSPLKDIPLKELSCDFKFERDTELLRSIKTLETINKKPSAEFWKEVETQQIEK